MVLDPCVDVRRERKILRVNPGRSGRGGALKLYFGTGFKLGPNEGFKGVQDSVDIVRGG